MPQSEGERRVAAAEVLRRLQSIEAKLGNGSGGVYVRRDVDEVEKRTIVSRLEGLEDQNKWLMRLIVATFLSVVASIILMTVNQ